MLRAVNKLYLTSPG